MEVDEIFRRVDRLERDIDLLFEKAHASAIAQAQVDTKLSSMMQTLVELKDGVNTLKQIPLKRYELIITTIITTVVGALLGFAVGNFFK